MTDGERQDEGPEDRVPCTDDMCVGIIGPDGKCGTCGKPGTPPAPWSRPEHPHDDLHERGPAPEPQAAEAAGPGPAAGTAGPGLAAGTAGPGLAAGTAGPGPGAGTAGPGPGAGTAGPGAETVGRGLVPRPASETEPETDDERVPCLDDMCVGILGPDGTCGTCGKKWPRS